MLEIEDLSVTYGRQIVALSGVNLTLGEREIVAVLGANGSGKSTLLRAISATIDEYGGRKSGGRIRYEGRDITRLPPHRVVSMGICQVPEGRLVFAPLTVTENLLAATRLRRRAAVRELLDSVFGLFPQLELRARQLAGLLSGGEQQMLAIGRALMAQPKAILIDEFSLGLAPMTVAFLREAIVGINRDLGISLLVVEQNARMALDMVHRAYVLQTGTVRISGASGELRDHPILQESYLGAGATD